MGIMVPIALTLLRETLGIFELLALRAIGVASSIGDFDVKYCIVKAGVYAPRVEATAVEGAYALA